MFKINDRSFNVINKVDKRLNGWRMHVENPELVVITSGYQLDGDDVLKIINDHKRFIYRRINVNNTKPQTLHLLGKEYDVKIIESDYENVLVDDSINLFKIYTKNNNPAHNKKIVYDYYKLILKNIVSKYYSEIKEIFNIDFDVKFKYKEIKTYYGECFSEDKIVILNIKDAKYELKYILSIIYHEFTHFYCHGHGKKFYDFIETKFPNYKKVQQELRKIRYIDLY